MKFRFSSGDISGFKCLISLCVLYGIMSMFVYTISNMKHIKPLAIDAPLDRFSEARAIKHIEFLTKEIDGRQEGRPGLNEAAKYIKRELEMLATRAGSDYRIEIEETLVSGSFNMMFLGHSISLAYRNHTNIVMRISSADSKDTDTALLVNGHFDSPLGSPGAADCGSCVASMLELARLTVDSKWIPPQPVIYLFNGAEELFLLGAHGFIKTHKWRNTIGAFINIEASGTGGIDLVCQSGPGSWPSHVYAQAAIHPMAHSAAQDVFPVVPGDTDYRIFAEDVGNIPGLDIIFMLGGYFYHTSYDTVERLLPGSIQARGENLFSLINAFTNSPRLQNTHEGLSAAVESNETKHDRAVFFDYLSWFMIFYSRQEALVFHSLPLFIFLFVPFFLHYPKVGVRSCIRSYYDNLKGMLFHTIGVILGIVIPIVFAILRLLFAKSAMNWYAHPYLAFLMFVPCSLVGLLIPRRLWALSDEARFWGTFGLYAVITVAYLLAGLSGGFLTFVLLISMVPARMCLCLLNKFYGHKSLTSIVGYLIILIPSITYSVYFGGFLVQFLIEKMGMIGSLPPPYGYFVQDVVVAAVVGAVTGFCVGPLLPVLGHWLGRSSIIQLLLHLTVVALALSSQFFPYSTSAPKRLFFQHTFVTSDAFQIKESSYDVSVVDSNSLHFIFKHAPEAARELQIGPDLSLEHVNQSNPGTWMVLVPVSFFFLRSPKFPANSYDMLKHYKSFPHLTSHKSLPNSMGPRRVYLELSLGSLEEVWVAVLNITGPLSSWSFADSQLPAPDRVEGGPPSYVCRLSGSSHENWNFWLEANSSEALQVDVAVLDQYMVDDSRKLISLFPDWVDVTAYSSFLSSYVF